MIRHALFHQLVLVVVYGFSLQLEVKQRKGSALECSCPAPYLEESTERERESGVWCQRHFRLFQNKHFLPSSPPTSATSLLKSTPQCRRAVYCPVSVCLVHFFFGEALDRQKEIRLTPRLFMPQLLPFTECEEKIIWSDPCAFLLTTAAAYI